jgi:hypothetical protein
MFAGILTVITFVTLKLFELVDISEWGWSGIQ